MTEQQTQPQQAQRPQPQPIRRGIAGYNMDDPDYNMDDPDYAANASIHLLWLTRQQEIAQSLQSPKV